MKIKFWSWIKKSSPSVQGGESMASPGSQNFRLVRFAETWLIDFTDALLVPVSQFCLMLGFISGTIAVLSTRYNINAMPWFNLTWAIIQAVAIDGLFFAVWAIWQRSQGKGWLRTWYFFIGVLLGCVASLVNDVVSFSELNRISTIALTMQQLHINESDFSLCRSVLVVLVSILIVTLPRGGVKVAHVIEQTSTPAVDTAQLLQSIQDANRQLVSDLVSQFSQVTVQMVREAVQIVPQLPEKCEGSDISDVRVSTGKCDDDNVNGSKVSIEQMPYALQIEQLYQQNTDITIAEIIRVTGCGRSTASKWLNKLKPVEVQP